jgi:cell division protein FtsL
MSVSGDAMTHGWRRRGAADVQRMARFHRERDRRRLRSMIATLGWTAMGVALVLGVVAVKVQQVRLSYRLDSLRTAAAQLQDDKRHLVVELASLRSPARIEERARAIGMIHPGRDQVQLAREFVTGADGVAAADPRRLTADRRTQ